VILCTAQYFYNFVTALVISGRISLKHFVLSNYHLAKFRREIFYLPLPGTPTGPGPPEAEFLFMGGVQIFGQNHQRQGAISI
jgi:hypothetical protein